MKSVRNPTLLLLMATMLTLLTIAFLTSYMASGEGNYSVEIKADDVSGQSGEPGEMVSYDIKVKNTGDEDDNYEVFVMHGDLIRSAKHWTFVDGLGDPSQNGTRGNESDGTTGTIPFGQWKYLDVIIEIPEYRPGSNDALVGEYGVKILVQSITNRTIIDEEFFEVEVEPFYNFHIWSDIPGKNETLRENDPTQITYTLNVRNLGNTEDDFYLKVMDDEFSGDKKDWTAKFGTQVSKTVSVGALQQATVTMTVTIDKNTDAGQYTLRVRANSYGDTATYRYETVYLNLTKGIYGVKLEQFAHSTWKVNPADESEIEFKFTLTNTGNQDDTYTIEVETPLGSGTYKGWTMEFENKYNERVDQLVVPADLKGNTDLYLSKNSRVDITLYVTVAYDEEEGFYQDITISATSDNDNAQTEYAYFDLTIILPNIRLFDDPNDFYIDPNHDIQEDDTIDIHIRIYNDGSAETDKFWVFFYNGRDDSPRDLAGNYIALEKVENIPVGQYYDIMATWDEIEGGENDIYVYADKPVKAGDGKTMIDNSYSDVGLVLETKENDNTASIDYPYQEALDLRPNLMVTSVEFDSREEGTTTNVSVTIANIGTAKAHQGSAQVSLKIGGTSIKSKLTNAINPFLPEEIHIDDDITVDFTWDIPDGIVNFTVKANVDHPDDRDGTNCRKTFYVQTTRSTSSSSSSDSSSEVSSETVVNYSLLTLVIGIIIGVLFSSWYSSLPNQSQPRGGSRPMVPKQQNNVRSPPWQSGPQQFIPPPNSSFNQMDPYRNNTMVRPEDRWNKKL